MPHIFPAFKAIFPKVSIFPSSALMLAGNNGFIISTSQNFFLDVPVICLYCCLLCQPSGFFRFCFYLKNLSVRIKVFLSILSLIIILLDISTCYPDLTFLLFP